MNWFWASAWLRDFALHKIRKGGTLVPPNRAPHLAFGTPLPVPAGRGAGGEGRTSAGGGVETPPFHGAACNAFLCKQALGGMMPFRCKHFETNCREK